jgi:myo-inositol 2-dehydrogenase/D-chiro-inositol 1-dehydrogenase
VIHYVLVGAGEAARYADALRRLPEVRIAAVVDEDEAGRGQAAELLGAAHQAARLGELLAAGTACDGVLVDGAPGARLDHARTALRHGKHVLLALPAASGAEQVASLTEECHAAGVSLMVSGTLRFLPSQQVLKQRLDAGTLGTLGLLRAHRWRGRTAAAATDLPPAELCRALSVPYLDLANWLFGARPDLVYARAAAPGYVQIHLGFAGGGMALIDVSDDLPPGDGYRSVTVIGSAGAGYADDHHNRNLVFGGGDAIARDPGEGNLELVAELKEFAAAGSGRRAPQVTGADAGAALQVAAAAASSAATGAVLERKGDHYE